MSKRYRLVLMALSFGILLVIGHFINNKNLHFVVNDFWFSFGLLLLIMLSLVDQPFFSKDSSIFVNAVTAALSLLLVPANERSVIFGGFFCSRSLLDYQQLYINVAAKSGVKARERPDTVLLSIESATWKA